MRITTKFSLDPLPYTGPELRPHYLLERWKVQGSAIAGFIGPCEVKTEHLVDWEDRLANDFIRSKLMLHFLGEFFGISLAEGVLYQRLFMATAGQEIARMSGKTVVRSGDDLFWLEGSTPDDEKTEAWGAQEGKKLSVSIVTASPVSRLLHVGINIDATGAPVRAAGLADLGVDPTELAKRVLESFAAEVEGIEWACAKVRPVV